MSTALANNNSVCGVSQSRSGIARAWAAWSLSRQAGEHCSLLSTVKPDSSNCAWRWCHGVGLLVDCTLRGPRVSSFWRQLQDRVRAVSQQDRRSPSELGVALQCTNASAVLQVPVACSSDSSVTTLSRHRRLRVSKLTLATLCLLHRRLNTFALRQFLLLKLAWFSSCVRVRACLLVCRIVMLFRICTLALHRSASSLVMTLI